ncbi:MAG: NAD-dependent epimerase/dehydratase family protein, partial [Candidatus Nanopelagicaceae bacterium]
MRYLITGGAGFIGSHLASRLLERGDEVVALDDLSTGSKGNVERFLSNPNFTLIEGSMLDKALLAKAMDGAHGLFHLG